MPPNSPLKNLLERTGEPAALDEMKRLGVDAVPELRRAYARLGEHDFMQAQWYNRLLAVSAADPAGEALTLLGKVKARHCPEVTWLLRAFVQPAHLSRLRSGLARRASWAAGHAAIDLPSILELPQLAAWCEGLGFAGQAEDLSLLGAVWQAARKELAAIQKGSGLFASDYAPVVSAAAAALLAISERHDLGNERERKTWRRDCGQTALAEGYANAYMISAQNPPMPWLFARAPREAAGLLKQLAETAQDAAAVLADLRYWLLTGQEQGAPAILDLSADDGLDWLDTLADVCDPASYGPKCALEIRGALRPANALQAVMWPLSRPGLDAKALREAADVVLTLAPFKDVAALRVEAYFIQLGCSRKPDDDARAELNDQLAKAGLAPLEGWRWLAPNGGWAGAESPQALHQTLCAIAQACARAARATKPEAAQAALAPLESLPAAPIITHAVRRNVLLALSAKGQAGREALLAWLEPLRAENDPEQVRAVLAMTAETLGSKGWPVHLRLLEAPAVRQSQALAEKVVQGLAEAPAAEAAGPALALAGALGWTDRKHAPELEIATTLALGRLGAVNSAATLARQIGHSGLGSDTEVTLLKMAAADPQCLDDMTFGRAFEEMVTDEYADHSPAMWGPQACAYVLRVLREADLVSRTYRPVCKFLADIGRKIEAPPEALPLLLAQLPQALASAKALPGEEWEDRNWGGYNASGAEDIAEALSQAVLSLCHARYSRAGWAELINGLLQVKGLSLSSVELADYTSSSFVYRVTDLYAVLRAGLLRLGDPGVKAALKPPAGPEALRAAAQALKAKG